MDVHKPKPWRGFREFLKEYLIIVVGVLTALGGEQVAENLHWRRLAAEAREEVAADDRRLAKWIGLADASSPCTLRRLKELTAILDQAEHDGRLPPLPAVNVPPSGIWNMRGWDSLVSSQVLVHFPKGEGAVYASQARSLVLIQEAWDHAKQDWGVLSTMAGPGRPLSAVEAAGLRAALGRASQDAYIIRRNADNLGDQLLDTKLVTRDEVAAWWKMGAGMLPQAFCAPLTSGAPSTVDSLLASPPAPPSQPWTRGDIYARLPS